MSPFGNSAFQDMNAMPSDFDMPPGTITLGSRANRDMPPPTGNTTIPLDDTPPF
jgi:hypothetical protein